MYDMRNNKDFVYSIILLYVVIHLHAQKVTVYIMYTGANYFFLLLIGGTISSFNNLVAWGAGSFLSEVWFPVTERATATAIAMAVSPSVGQSMHMQQCLICAAMHGMSIYFSHTYNVMHTFQIGILLGVGATPLIIHRPDTVDICGNGTNTPSPSPAQYADWSNAIHNQLFYYVLAQAVLSILLLFVIFLGTSFIMTAYLCISI